MEVWEPGWIAALMERASISPFHLRRLLPPFPPQTLTCYSSFSGVKGVAVAKFKHFTALTCFIFSKSESSPPPASVLLPAGFALRGDNRRKNGKQVSASAVESWDGPHRQALDHSTEGRREREQRMERHGDGRTPEKEGGQLRTWNLKTRRYDRVKPQQSRCESNHIPSAALQQKEEVEEEEQHRQIGAVSDPLDASSNGETLQQLRNEAALT